MDFWQVLGLEPNADAKAIKLAYSKLLKQTRPDDNPEGFQQLREAYKAALKAANATSNPNSSLTINADIKPEETLDNSANIMGSAVPASATIAVASPAQTEWEEFIADVEALVARPDKCNQIRNWKTIIQSHASILEDLKHRRKASEWVFCLLADTRLDRDAKETVQTDVLQYLSDEFQWEKNHYQLLHRFGEQRTSAVFSCLDEQRVDTTIRLVAGAGSVLTLLVIACGYFGVSFVAVVLIAAVFGSARRLYVRQWQMKRQGFTNGGDASFMNDNKYVYVGFIYVVACFVEALFYGLGWVIRYGVSALT